MTRHIERRIRILIADDHPVLLRGLRIVLNAQPDLEVVAEATDGEQALECALSSRGLPRAPGTTWREFCALLAQRGMELPGDFAEQFDDVRYGSLAGALAPPTQARLRATVTAAIAADRSPRLARQLRAWSGLVRSLLQRARATE